MPDHGGSIWALHPHVRSGAQLTLGERAADFLKKWFGTWTALGFVGLWIVVWVALQKTGFHWDLYPFILLNLCLSCLAAVQGIILQISANRQDRINAELQQHHTDQTDKIDQLLVENTDLTRQMSAQSALLGEMHDQIMAGGGK